MQPLPARLPSLPATCFVVWCAAFSSATMAQAPAQPVPAKEKGPTTIDAERIEGVMDIEVSAGGNAELRQDETTIFGDRIKFNQEFGRIDASGGVRLQQGADRFSGSRLRFDSDSETGVLEDPVFSIRSGDKPARGKAERIDFLGKGRYALRKGSFTTCEPGNDDWSIEADSLELDYNEQSAVVRSGRLRFLDNTIAVLPWMTFPLEKGRKTGMLAPGYTQSTRSGLEISTPFYWNISPEKDATITPRYLSKRGTQLQTEYRYLDPKYSGTASFEYLPDDKRAGINRYGLSLYHQHTFSPNLFGRLDVNKVSDSRYFVDLFSKVRQTSQASIQREGFLQYNGDSYWLQGRIQRFQTLQDPLAPIVSPYHRVPQISFGTWKNEVAGLADLALPAEFARFTHSTLVEGTRILTRPSISAPYLTPGFFFTPKAGVHYAGYNLDRTAVGQPERQNITVPWMSLDSGLIFERPTTLAGRQYTQTIEPRLFYVRAPYRNQDQVPLFDTALADFNYTQLFSENRFAGGDRFGDANQLTAAATTRLLFPNGQEFLRATIGQRFYFSDERVGLNAPNAGIPAALVTPAPPLRTFGNSDLLASVGARVAQNWNFDTTVQYNSRLARTERAGVNLRYSPEFAKFINFGYRFTRDVLNPIDQIDISGQWPIRQGWYAVGRYNYSFQDGRLLEGVGGLEYNAGCWVVRFVVQRLQVATQLASTSYYVQLELNDLAQIGSDPFDLLKRAIPGYTATNTRTDQPLPATLQRRLPFEQVY
jgi:LPS-assembly protein